MVTKEFIKQGQELKPVSYDRPNKTLTNFYTSNKEKLNNIIQQLKHDDVNMKNFTIHASLMNPMNSVIHDDVKNFCCLPYQTIDGQISTCPGIPKNWKACAPYAPSIDETIKLLSNAVSFLIIQFEGSEADTKQSYIHPFIENITTSLNENGYSTIETYASGPCRICPQGCGDNEVCRQPKRRLFALEACGFWVNSLCSCATEFPVTTDAPKQVKWIKKWGLPAQDTQNIRYTTGILL